MKRKTKTQKIREKIIKKIIEYIAGIILLSIFFLMFMYGITISPTIIK